LFRGDPLAAGLVVLFAGLPAGAQDLTLTSWSGPYMRSQMLAFVRPFEEATGKEVNVEFYNGGLEEVRRQVRSANVKWDVVDFLEENLIQACKEGLLASIDPAALAPGADGTPPEADFIANGRAASARWPGRRRSATAPMRSLETRRRRWPTSST
jgi:putative spermidine/putrescine transport system substrate-binding protein